MTTILMLGGARSGKSRLAEKKAGKLSLNRTYIATAEASDEEMKYRIARHQQDRDKTWTTIECPLNLSNTICKYSNPGSVTLIDCLTLWLSNLMHYQYDVDKASRKLLDAIIKAPGHVVLVSNEVGMGLVPNFR